MQEPASKGASAGKIIAGVLGTSACAMIALSLPFVAPGFRRVCLPFVPCSETQLSNVLQFLRGARGPVVDLGSGNGKIVLAAAKQGLRAEGLELNSVLVWWSRVQALRSGLWSLASFHRKDIFKASLSKYNNVVVFGAEDFMGVLKDKLEKELAPQTQVIACRFPVPSWSPIDTIGTGIDTVWLYRIPESYRP
ncbi:FAM173B [Cordylochernes scorpioides]|uniref:FAM173B n=1 Tax=Cordylochernes scorpioides TaxID=51811 RepID=A0ABY6KKV1_9ARAC|nr:FAM173B [Cordylochernes scorpioides]